MNWVVPLEKDSATDTLEKRFWAADGQFCVNHIPVVTDTLQRRFENEAKKP